MTEREMLGRSDSQMIQLKRTSIKTIAKKCPTSQDVPCPYCGKTHKYFWRLPDDRGFKPDSTDQQGYISRRYCRAIALKLR